MKKILLLCLFTQALANAEFLVSFPKGDEKTKKAVQWTKESNKDCFSFDITSLENIVGQSYLSEAHRKIIQDAIDTLKKFADKDSLEIDIQPILDLNKAQAEIKASIQKYVDETKAVDEAKSWEADGALSDFHIVNSKDTYNAMLFFISDSELNHVKIDHARMDLYWKLLMLMEDSYIADKNPTAILIMIQSDPSYFKDLFKTGKDVLKKKIIEELDGYCEEESKEVESRYTETDKNRLAIGRSILPELKKL